MRIVRRFVADRPGWRCWLTESGSARELLDLLEFGELDLTLRVLPLPEDPFDGVELMRDPYVLLVAADDPPAMACGAPLLGDVAGLPMIGFRTCVAGERTEEFARREGVEPRMVLRSDGTGTLEGLVGAGWRPPWCPCWPRTRRIRAWRCCP